MKYYWRNLTLSNEHLYRQSVSINTRTKICVSQRFRGYFAMEIWKWKSVKMARCHKARLYLLVGYDVLLINDHLYSRRYFIPCYLYFEWNIRTRYEHVTYLLPREMVKRKSSLTYRYLKMSEYMITRGKKVSKMFNDTVHTLQIKSRL